MNTNKDTNIHWEPVAKTPYEENGQMYLFSKEEMDELIKWKPVSNIPVEEIYKDLPEVKQYHENFVKLWNLKTR